MTAKTRAKKKEERDTESTAPPTSDKESAGFGMQSQTQDTMSVMAIKMAGRVTIRRPDETKEIAEEKMKPEPGHAQRLAVHKGRKTTQVTNTLG